MSVPPVSPSVEFKSPSEITLLENGYVKVGERKYQIVLNIDGKSNVLTEEHKNIAKTIVKILKSADEGSAIVDLSSIKITQKGVLTSETTQKTQSVANGIFAANELPKFEKRWNKITTLALECFSKAQPTAPPLPSPYQPKIEEVDEPLASFSFREVKQEVPAGPTITQRAISWAKYLKDRFTQAFSGMASRVQNVAYNIFQRPSIEYEVLEGGTVSVVGAASLQEIDRVMAEVVSRGGKPKVRGGEFRSGKRSLGLSGQTGSSKESAQLMKKLIDRIKTELNQIDLQNPSFEDSNKLMIIQSIIKSFYESDWVSDFLKKNDEVKDQLNHLLTEQGEKLQSFSQVEEGLKWMGPGEIKQRAQDPNEKTFAKQFLLARSWFGIDNPGIEELPFTADSRQLAGSEDPVNPDSTLALNKTSLDAVSNDLVVLFKNGFAKLSAKEFAKQAWSKKETQNQTSPNVMEAIELFNQTSEFVARAILDVDDLDKRAKRMQFFINLEQKSIDAGELNSAMAIHSGLNNSAVFRLNKTKGALKDSYKKMLESQDALLSTQSNYKNLRGHINDNPAAIPYFGMLLTDMTFTDDSLSSKNNEGMFNTQKLQTLASSLDLIASRQPTALVPPQNNLLATIQSYQEDRDADKDYARSLTLEPRQKKYTQV